MPELSQLLPGLYATLLLMVMLWLISVPLRNVSIIDMFWGVAVAGAGLAYWTQLEQPGTRANLCLLFAGLWALRLWLYLFKRTLGKPEDRRYADMRRRHDPGFWWKSLVIVFVLQAVLGWVISMPLYGAMQGDMGLGLMDFAGVGLFIFGLCFETIADWQLARFLRQRANSEAVLDSGVWRYSRHPNYFGEFCLWWGFWLMAASAGAWWTIIGPLLLSFFLLKVSGVTMLEKDIGERRPAYQDYIRKTAAFFPRLPKS
jgi:steroid 5-alpha reductase family enzyme